MKKVLTSLIALVAVAAMAMTANAAVTVTLVTPPEGDVSNPGHFPNIEISVGDAIEQQTTVEMKSEAGDVVTCSWYWAGDMIVECNKVTKSGKWTLTLPAGILNENGDDNEEISWTWNYTNPTEGEGGGGGDTPDQPGDDATPFDLSARIANTVDNKTVYVQPGESFENADYLPNIQFDMPETGYTINNTGLQLTSDKGFDKNITVNSMFYEKSYANQVLVMVGSEEIKESATYTLHVPAGFATSATESSKAVDFSWTYTYTGGSEGPDTPAELVVKSVSVGGVDIKTTPALAAINPNDEIVVNIDPIPEAVMLEVRFKDETNDEFIRTFEIRDNEYNKDVVAKPAEGYYRTLAGGDAVNKFYTGTEYGIIITAYSTINVGNPANIVWGPQTVTFSGATEPYKYSPVTVASVTPENNFEVVDASQPIVITYSAPVTVDKIEASTGGQGATVVDMLPYATPNADKTVWTIKPGKAFWEGSTTDWMFMIYAKDENGLVVKGNSGEDAESYYQVIYSCFMGWPTVDISPASGMVEELYTFTIANTRGISLSYNYVPYVVNADGETVAKVDMNSQIQYDAAGNNINDVEGRDIKAVKATFHLTAPITEPGKYTLISPRSCYAIGTEFDADNNRYFETEYTVVKMPKAKVDVELVNFANVSFQVLQGKDATVALTPSADWKLATLTLNGEDVTKAVADNAYTIAAIEADAKLVATYEYAYEVETIQTSGVVDVAGKQITVANDGDRISVEGVAEGDTIKVYTVNGMVIANVVAEQDIVKISCPTGQVYIVVINDKAVKIQH